MEIRNISELADAIGCKIQSIGKALFKGTECGIVFNATDNGVSVCGYAEGADAECLPIVLRYPFTMAEFWQSVTDADTEGCELWHEWNSDNWAEHDTDGTCKQSPKYDPHAGELGDVISDIGGQETCPYCDIEADCGIHEPHECSDALADIGGDS